MVKIQAILSFLSEAPGREAVQKLTIWRAHPSTGGRKGSCSLTVTRNWRITFRANDENAIEELNFEDYH